MKRHFMAAAFAVGLVLPGLVAAQSVGVAARGGTLGLGGELNVDLNKRIGFRGGVGAIPVKPSGDVQDVKYKVKPPTLVNVGLDLYPTGGAFRLSGGLLFKHDVTMDAQAANSFTFNDVTYTPAQAGTVHGDVAWGSTSPYASFGFAGRGKGFGLTFDLGAVFMGEPTITLTSTGGSLSNNATFRQNLLAAQDSAQHDAGKYLKVLPILSIAIRYGF